MFNFKINSIIVVLFCLRVAIISSNHTIYSYPKSCKYIDENELRRDIILIQINDQMNPFSVKCNQKIEGGGWTYILNRYDGSFDFNLDWNDYIYGFGNINQEFFIGLKKLHEITTSALHELLFVMQDFDNDTRIARYDAFAIDDENNAFTMTVLGNYNGTAGDSFTFQSGHKFLTLNKASKNQCSKIRDSPGWFNHCSKSNIFGHYLKGMYMNSYDGSIYGQGMYWGSFRGPNYSLKTLSMFIRPLHYMQYKMILEKNYMKIHVHS